MAARVGEGRSYAVASFFASLGFVVLIMGITYFAILVLSIRFGAEADRAAAYYELGYYLSGKLQWYRDARVYGLVALLCSLISILFGTHRLARITIPIAGACYLVLHVFHDEISSVISEWARLVSRSG